MKTVVISAVAVFTFGVLCAADGQPDAVETSAVKKVTFKGFDKDKNLSPEERDAKIAEMKRKRQERKEAQKAAREEKMAAAAGMTIEEWSKLDKEAQNAKMREVFKAKRLERDKKAAEKAGVPLEEYLRQRDENRKMKNAERKAKKCALKPMPGAKLVDDPKATEAGK